MTHLDAFDRQLESWLEAEADIPAPTALHERVLEPTTHRRPRHANLAWVGSHWISDLPAGTLSTARWARPVLVMVVILLLLGAAILVGGIRREEPLSNLPLLYSRDGDILMADWDGTNPVVIADGAPSTEPFGTRYELIPWPSNGSVWAPDRNHFVYHELHPWQVPGVITHISDASRRRLASFVIEEPLPGETAPPTPGPDAEVRDRRLKLSIWRTWWSPDSTMLAAFPWDAEAIRIFGLDGRLRYDLPLPDGYGMWREGGLTWAPDGRSVLVVITSQGPYDDLSEREVWQLPLDGSTPSHLSNDNPLASWDLRATHDGRRIAFSGHNSPFEDGPIFVANGDGSDPRPVAHTHANTGTASFPMWSPDEMQIAYIVGLDEAPLSHELRIVDLRTGVDRVVMRARSDGSINHGWFPDSSRLLFQAYWLDPAIKTALWSVRPDGTDLRLVVEGVETFGPWP